MTDERHVMWDAEALRRFLSGSRLGGPQKDVLPSGWRTGHCLFRPPQVLSAAEVANRLAVLRELTGWLCWTDRVEYRIRGRAKSLTAGTSPHLLSAELIDAVSGVSVIVRHRHADEWLWIEAVPDDGEAFLVQTVTCMSVLEEVPGLSYAVYWRAEDGAPYRPFACRFTGFYGVEGASS